MSLFSALIEDRPDDARKILAGDKPVDTKDVHGLTPLMIACRHGYLDIVETLLSSHADPNAKDDLGQTPVIIAATYGHTDILKLLKHGDLEAVDIFGKNGLQYADVPTAKILISLGKIIKEIPKNIPEDVHNCIQDAKDELGYELFFTTRENMKLLLNKGANPNVKDEYGDTSLTLASRLSYTEIVEQLLSNGADPNVQNKYGETALIRASRYGYLDIVQILLSNGADPNVQDKCGGTALMNASCNGDLDIVQILLSNGANHVIQRCKSARHRVHACNTILNIT
jgi:ankyrin repeat protein